MAAALMQVASAAKSRKYAEIIMGLRTRSAHKITPTAARKRPSVRLCGGGSNRPDRGNKKLAPQGPVRAGKRHSIFFDIFLIFKLLYRRIHAYIYAGSDINAKAERRAMKSPILYFAYGSNMNPVRGSAAPARPRSASAFSGTTASRNGSTPTSTSARGPRSTESFI